MARLIRILHYLCAQNNILHEHSITYRRTSPHPVRCKRTDRRSGIRCQTLPHTQYRYRTDNRCLRNISSGVDGQRIFRPERKRRYCHRQRGGQQYLQHTDDCGLHRTVRPNCRTRNTLQKEIPLCILSSIALLVCANDIFLNGDKANTLSITDGLLLLCFFAIFLSYTFAIASHSPEETAGSEETIRQLPLWKSVLYILGGLGALIAGGSFFVDGASGIARSLGVSESVIGLTLVAGGTSLPELATSIVAALKKNPEIAIGNVVGSNLFNVFFVLGCSASITPLHLTGITNLDLWVLAGSGILLWFFGLFFAKRTITRIEGSIMVLCYVAYTTFLIYNL